MKKRKPETGSIHIASARYPEEQVKKCTKSNMIRKMVFKSIIVFSFLGSFDLVFSQNNDSTKRVNNFKIVTSVTNNGISLIPTFSLGKPAIIFDASMGQRLTFDPLIRYSLEGKPWSFIFWWRYKLLKPGKFQFTIGAHPSVLFKTINGTVNGVPTEIMRARQYVVGELYPYYILSKNINFGVYYNYSRGLAADDIRNTNFLTLRMGISNIVIFKDMYLSFVPQVYYLKMDSRDGFYITSAFMLSKKNFPFSISSVINRTLETEIVSDNFVWNISLNYTISQKIVNFK